MKQQNITAIILGHRDIGEYHKLIFCYSDQIGKFKAIAKGARKLKSRFTGHLETLNIVNCSLYFGPRNTILIEIETIHCFPEIRNDFPKLQAAFKITEITEKSIFENQQINSLLKLIKESLQYLEKTNKPNNIANFYIIKFLDKLGLLPNFQELNLKLANKYNKFFKYSQQASFQELAKLNLTIEEQATIENLIFRILQTQSDYTFNTVKTPSIAANSSIKSFN